MFSDWLEIMKIISILVLICALTVFGAFGQEIFNWFELETPPKPIKEVTPESPELARRGQDEGKIIVQITIGIDGKVEEAEVIKAEPEGFFEEATLEAAYQWEFTSTTKDGEPIRVIYQIPFNFKLTSNDEVIREVISIPFFNDDSPKTSPEYLSPIFSIHHELTKDGIQKELSSGVPIIIESVSESESNPYDRIVYIDTIQSFEKYKVRIDTYKDCKYAYARADGYFTSYYPLNSGSKIIDVIITPIPQIDSSITGIIILGEGHDGLCKKPFRNKALWVKMPDGREGKLITDEEGRYLIKNAPLGKYVIGPYNSELPKWDEGNYEYYDPSSITVFNYPGMDYCDLNFSKDYACTECEAPNIYIYPEIKTKVSVTLEFPGDNYLTISEPTYNNGWSVIVDTNGSINNGECQYLFYESKKFSIPQLKLGWIMTIDDIRMEIISLLFKLGFNDREATDFLDHWAPILEEDGHPYFAFYPQDPQEMSKLTINPAPDSVLRILFLIRPLKNYIEIDRPSIEPFERKGFVVVEWGVIRDFN